MCGFTGLWLPRISAEGELEARIGPMAAAIAHRGPDDQGIWSDLTIGLALAHRRLAILDLSVAAHQPMHSASGRYVIAFNGEVYNHLRIRRDLEAQGQLQGPWRGHSDTETLLAAIEAWGLESALQRCAGMWALALWDRRLGLLHLARDRFGEKSLYWGTAGSGQQRLLLFGSDLAALRACDGFAPALNRAALAHLLQFGYVPAPSSIYAGIAKLPAGHLLSISLPLPAGEPLPVSRPWWQLVELIQVSARDPFRSDAEGLDALEHALAEVVAEQAIADVPLGAFLSGGIDSSLITALLQQTSSSPVRTFTIAFEEEGFNEAPYAAAVAAHLGTQHTEVMLSSADALDLIPQLPSIYSEPFADSSQLPTHLVCRSARAAGLTVALSGDGGDELFGGYNRYFWGPRIWNRLALLPPRFRRVLSRTIRSLPPPLWDILASPLPIHQIGQKAHKLAARLPLVDGPDALYRSLVQEWNDPLALLHQADLTLPATVIDVPLPACLGADPVARMMAWDALSYLPDDILVKVDRAAMAVGLETRAPFLDHRVAQIAWRLPMALKVRSGVGKWALRQLLDRHVPRRLTDRPKAGFAMPIGEWLRGPLKPWASNLLLPQRLRLEGYLNPAPIDALWHQHLSGRYDHTTRLWPILMWQAWLEFWS